MSGNMEFKMWRPALTSQFLVCPVPFHLDTYRGCVYDCSYCFARDFITFSRRNSEHKESTYLIANYPTSFNKWMARVDKQVEYNFEKGAEVAIKERIPLKIGANSDPCPPIETSTKVTRDFLNILGYYDYPTEIQTKNPQILTEILKTVSGNLNLVIAVTLISTDKEFVRVCEPNAPSPQERLDAIKELTDMGYKVMVKIQPAIYPKIVADLPHLIRGVKDAGCWAVNIEGLKMRISMPKPEQVLFQSIGDAIGEDLRQFFRTTGKHVGSDWEYSPETKKQYIDLALSLCREHGIKCLVADNFMGAVGDGCECCGTQALRNYKIWGNNARTRGFGRLDNESTVLGETLVNFTRSFDGGKALTMNEMAKDYIWREKKEISMIHTSFPGETREYREASPTLSTACGGGHLPYIKHETDDAEFMGGSIRRLTPVEYERLQGFPDNFTEFGINSKGHKIKISDTQRYKCLGNAVSVPVVKEVAKRLLPYLLEGKSD